MSLQAEPIDSQEKTEADIEHEEVMAWISRLVAGEHDARRPRPGIRSGTAHKS